MRPNRRRAAVLALGLLASSLPVALAPTAGAATPPVVINEVLASHTGTDDTEFIELYGPPGTSLDGVSIVVVEGDAGASQGAIDRRLDLGAADVIGDNGFFLVGNPAGLADYGVTPDVAITNDYLENSSLTVALVQTATISGTAVSGAEVALDAVGLTDGGASDAFYLGATVIGPDGSFFPAGARRVTDGVDTDAVADWVLADFNLGAANTPTPGGAVTPPPPATPCQAITGVVPIGVVQGSGAATPCAGDDVTVEGVVVGDYEGTPGTLRGFYVQDAGDGDPATSDGIFVFNGNADSVAVGDRVRVEGTAGEFQDQTQLSDPAVTVLASGQPSPPATPAALPLPTADALEPLEGMVVTFPQPLVVTEHFQLGRFGQVVVSSGDRLDQPTAVAAPGAAANAVQDANDRNRLILDDARQLQNPDPIVNSRGGTGLTATNTLRGGDTVVDATGVLTYTWAGSSASGNAYRLRPPSPASPGFDFAPANPRPDTPPTVGGDLRIASFNVLNYFPTIDLADVCGPDQDLDCRGADTALELERQRAKLLPALLELDADVLGLVELENTPGVSPEQDLADRLNDVVGAGTYAAVDAGVIGTDAIRVGIVYRTGAVTPLGDPAVLTFSPGADGTDRSRPALAQSFVDTDGEVLTVVVNHLKSKGASGLDSVCATPAVDPDCDQGDGQGYWNATRTRHAEELVEWLATDPTGSGDADVLVLGDLNAYAQEDPIGVLAAAGYVDLEPRFEPSAYGYVFDGQWGRLDYALASPSLASQVTGAASWHVNADEPNVLDYNTNFKPVGQIDSLFRADPFRTSDHDPVLVGLSPASGLDAVALDDGLFPPNHQLVDVVVHGFGDQVTVLGATSSEADAGLGDDDVPGDIGTPEGDTIPLRAERFSRDGRTYTVDAVVTDGTQVRHVEVDALVPHNRGRRFR